MATGADHAAHVARARAWWDALGPGPKYAVGPMVDHSELPFRLLCRRHGATLAYTPMLHAAQFATSRKVRARAFDGWPAAPSAAPGGADRPLLVQFAGCDAATILAAARHVEGCVDGVDLNFGCPQRIAHRGAYGAFLLERDWEWLVGLVREVACGLRVPLSVKLRLVMDERGEPSTARTVELCTRLERAGVALIALHGRTRLQINRLQRAADWAAIAAVKRALAIPLLANGGIYTRADVVACLRATGADGVMAAEGLLEDPALFGTAEVARELLAAEYLQLAREHPPNSLRPVRAHLFELLHADVGAHPRLCARLRAARSFEQLEEGAAELIAARAARRRGLAGVRDGIEGSWYHRHRALQASDGTELEEGCAAEAGPGAGLEAETETVGERESERDACGAPHREEASECGVQVD
ncbi:hypothetical protein KFE25_011365 [Diacronema lutheri]|uniref:tRNA-dihydrouridine(16/17) synthase [NAD(P)(+)] n=1 Tax=Diacronema lutheri TaxID=2081491 RepID=A0A8J5XD11_DIALT|nr:hypothetical protein KFE25_011365 [Diacronema lutheri]